ncbi:MAG: ATP-binding protein [Candidatus Aminicenantes bacterium]|nr:ATP-binding protein [Candidatus Aminicenantes bacterium]
MEQKRQKGARLIGALIILLIVLFFTIEFFIRETQEFSPTSFTNLLLSSLQIIVLLLFLILLFVLGRNLVKLYLERKHKVVGAHFKTKLVFFFIGLSLIPTLLLFLFASDLISRNIERWFQTPFDRIMADTKEVADGFYQSTSDITYHYAQQLAETIRRQKLAALENRLLLRDFIWSKLTEYQLDEIGIYLEDEELFTYLNPNLPLEDYRPIQANMIQRAHLGEIFESIEPMGQGEMVRRGVSLTIPEMGHIFVATGKFIPQSYAQKIKNISGYIQRYRLLMIQRNPMKAFYIITLLFVTLLIVFAASWIGFHLAKSITVPIEKLALATKEVSKGNLDVRVEDPASDEIGTLIESFNQMIADLRESQKNIALKTAELENRRHYIETILYNITTGVITLNEVGNIVTINPSAREMLGLPRNNQPGLSYLEILKDSRYHEICRYIDWGLKNRTRLSDKEVNIIVNGQTVTLALSLIPLRSADNTFSGLIVVLDNLTQLIQAQKMAAWKEVAQRVAHEIKNPLTPIQLSAERILKTLQKENLIKFESIEEGAKTILQEARSIKSLVDEFSNFARLPKIQLQPHDLHQTITQVVSLFRGIFNEIEFELNLADDVPSPLMIDPEQIKRVLINLFDNAIEAMNKKGKISLRTRFDKSQNRVIIEVADNGPGIPEEDKNKLFLPYFSTKRKGTGLGLAIVHQIVKEHNGTISVDDNIPNGAKFIIQLPT